MVRFCFLEGATLALALACATAHPLDRLSKRHSVYSRSFQRIPSDVEIRSPEAASSAIEERSGKSKITYAGEGTLHALLPASGYKEGWTVSKTHPNDAKMHHLTLSDSTFIVEKNIKDLSHKVVTEDGKKAIHAHFQKGAYDLKPKPAGGFSFYTHGPQGSKKGKPIVSMNKAKEISFAYSVKFSKGYGFNLGGKLPGLYGGTDDGVAATCSGGDHDPKCFSTRFMFREDGKGELYLYIPPHLNRDNLCGDDGYSECRAPSSNGKTYGASIGTGLWKFPDGKWTTIRQVIHLNDAGKRNGWAKVYVNGSSQHILYVQEIAFRESDKETFWGIQAQTFHGGHTPEWGTPHAQDSWFADWTIAITEYE